MDNIVNAIGGYNSAGFATLLVISLLGTPLVRLHWAFLPLPLISVVLILSYLQYTIAQMANPPLAVQIVPLLFAIAVIVGIIWGFTKSQKRVDKKQ